MATGISYCDEVWNVLAGCEKIGKGCKHCWAERMTIRQNAMAAARGDDDMWATYSNVLKFDYSEIEEGKAVGWNGQVEILGRRLDKPLHWRKPRRIFVNSMSDLFHKDVPFEFIAKILAVAAMCPQHTFMLFTKRWERAAEFYRQIYEIESSDEIEYLAEAVEELGGDIDAVDSVCSPPMSNVHLYFSASTQAEVDEAASILLKIPVAVRGLSLEPLLGPITLEAAGCCCRRCGGCGDEYPTESVPCHVCGGSGAGSRLKHIIVGCESGPNRRPCKIEWIRDIVRQCKEAGVLCYVKQIEINGKVSTNPEDWPEDLRIREMP